MLVYQRVTSFCFKTPYLLTLRELPVSPTKDLYIRIWGWCKYIILRRLVGWSGRVKVGWLGGGRKFIRWVFTQKDPMFLKKNPYQNLGFRTLKLNREFFRGIFLKPLTSHVFKHSKKFWNFFLNFGNSEVFFCMTFGKIFFSEGDGIPWHSQVTFSP